MMEVSCPKCTQRLRYSDRLVNPLLRCRNCLTTFRPDVSLTVVEDPVAAVVVDEYAGEDDATFRKFVAEPSQQNASESSSTSRRGKSGVGYFAIIILLIAFKVGPRLMRELFREPKPQPPVQLHQDQQQAVQKLLQDAAENAENAGARQKNRLPPMPNRFVPRDP